MEPFALCPVHNGNAAPIRVAEVEPGHAVIMGRVDAVRSFFSEMGRSPVGWAVDVRPAGARAGQSCSDARLPGYRATRNGPHVSAHSVMVGFGDTGILHYRALSIRRSMHPTGPALIGTRTSLQPLSHHKTRRVVIIIAADIFVGNVAVGVVPDARGWNDKLRADLVPSSGAVGDEIGKNISKGVVDNLGSSTTKAKLAKAGDESGGAFSDGFKKRLKAALDSLPQAKLDADSTEADRKVAELRARMEELLGKEIGVDISTKEATAEILKIDTALESVRRESKDIRVTFDTKEARAQLALLRRDAGATGGSSGGIVSKIGSLFGRGSTAAAPALASGAGTAASSGASGGGGIVSTLFSNPASSTANVAGIITRAPFTVALRRRRNRSRTRWGSRRSRHPWSGNVGEAHQAVEFLYRPGQARSDLNWGGVCSRHHKHSWRGRDGPRPAHADLHRSDGDYREAVRAICRHNS